MPTLFDEMWDAHAVGQRADGRTLIYVDRHMIHDLAGNARLKAG